MKLSNTLQGYQKDWLSADISAGLIVAIVIVPQAIAYAMLAGLPPQSGLYAALLPAIFYALAGTSPTLAVGPVAVVSLMTLESVKAFAAPGSDDFIALSATLALLVAAFYLLYFMVDLGRWTTFISHSVISAFTSAAAILILLNQIKYFTGLSIPRSGHVWEPLTYSASHSSEIVPQALMISVLGLLLLWGWQRYAARLLARSALPKSVTNILAKAGPLLLVGGGIIATQAGQLPVSTVGHIPGGLPSLQFPALFSHDWQGLLPSAAVIALIGYLESLSVGNSMARAQGIRLQANQELLALALANAASAISRGYPVAGGFGRSMVNFSAGARSQMSSIVMASTLALVCLFATDWFATLPHAILGVIVALAVWPLIRFQDGWHAWRFRKSDGLVWLATFTAVLLMGAEQGILLGMMLSLALYLKRTSEPHIAEIGRFADSDHFRNVLRHQVTTCPEVLMVRIDENLYFANSQFLLDYIAQRLQDKPQVRHVVLVGSAINYVDFSGFEALSHLLSELHDKQIELHLAEFKGPVMDQINKTDLLERLQPGRVFFTASEALRHLGNV